MRILFVTNTPPVPTQGGAMTFYRHFVERNDFVIAVVTDNAAVTKFDLPYQYLLVNQGRLAQRISNTRLFPFVQTYRKLVGVYKLADDIFEFAEKFRPDAIFTVAGTWNWMALVAKKLARQLNLPLIGSFNDWWFYAGVHAPLFSKLLEKRFRKFYQECDFAICTSDGMQRELGNHRRSEVIYPTGASAVLKDYFTPSKDKFTVAFAGNLGDWYGPMLEQLATAAGTNSSIEFKIYGFNPSWSAGFDATVRQTGIYKGSLPYHELGAALDKSDCLLLLMGFGSDIAMIEKTSFKTKFLDYITLNKPIVLWGPAYCSAIYPAREFDSAAICTSENPLDCLALIKEVAADPHRQSQLVANAKEMYKQRFNPNRLHQDLVRNIYAAIEENRQKRKLA